MTEIYRDSYSVTAEVQGVGPYGIGHTYKCTMALADGTQMALPLTFQKGPPAKYGANGWTNEALLAVLINRTTYINGLFPCAENDQAIEHMKQALAAFQCRTSNRKQRGVEGKETL